MICYCTTAAGTTPTATTPGQQTTPAATTPTVEGKAKSND